uniref:Uncharacterized protein n=1 Tax=Pectinophora gossypiella TaxID=13191 RepID=A0A1E1WLV6_PECGO
MHQSCQSVCQSVWSFIHLRSSGESHLSANTLRMVLVVPRTRASRDAHRFLIMAAKPSTRASANIPDALQRHGSPTSILNALLYWTRRSLYFRCVKVAHRLHV